MEVEVGHCWSCAGCGRIQQQEGVVQSTLGHETVGEVGVEAGVASCRSCLGLCKVLMSSADDRILGSRSLDALVPWLVGHVCFPPGDTVLRGVLCENTGKLTSGSSDKEEEVAGVGVSWVEGVDNAGVPPP